MKKLTEIEILEILDIIKDTIGVLVKDRQRKIDEIDDTMKFMTIVLDKNDIWAYSVGDVTADELYIKLKEAKGPGSYINHDLFMNILVDWMLHLGGEQL